MNRTDLLKLIDKFLAGEANAEEMDILSRYYNSYQLTKDWNESELGQQHEAGARIFNQIRKKTGTGIHPNPLTVNGGEGDGQKARVISMKPRVFVLRIVKIAAAACVLGLLVWSVSLWFNSETKTELSKAETNKGSVNDVLPGGDKAIVTLGNGSSLELNKAQDGLLAQEGGARLIKNQGKLSYQRAGTSPEAIIHNTVSTPRGGQYQVSLPDGSQVWLNASSSINFPTTFSGKERRVKITGEAYFEVAKNKSMPFVVDVNGAEVRVLGTHFNVMAYPDEAAVKTTLLEGLVQFVKGREESLLQPGQQSQMTKEGGLKVVSGIQTSEVIAWKNRMFYFRNADIETVMRQLARWYDVEVDIKGVNTKQLFVIEMPRSSKLSDVLHVLELTGKIKCKIEGKRISVTQ